GRCCAAGGKMTLNPPRTIFVCSCEGSMPGFGDSVARGCKNAHVQSGDQFCGVELDRVRSSLSAGGAVTVACTQQAPLFREVAEDIGFAGDLAFANIRETAGWSKKAAAAGPKAAALVAMVAESVAPPALVTLTSN